jgi:hypothetical protein
VVHCVTETQGLPESKAQAIVEKAEGNPTLNNDESAVRFADTLKVASRIGMSSGTSAQGFSY